MWGIAWGMAQDRGLPGTLGSWLFLESWGALCMWVLSCVPFCLVTVWRILALGPGKPHGRGRDGEEDRWFCNVQRGKCCEDGGGGGARDTVQCRGWSTWLCLGSGRGRKAWWQVSEKTAQPRACRKHLPGLEGKLRLGEGL